jgi:hypothetical protein
MRVATVANPTEVSRAEWMASSPTACCHQRVVNPGGGQTSEVADENELMTTTPRGM